MVCFRYINVNTLHKGDKKDDDYDDDDDNNNRIPKICKIIEWEFLFGD
jgi:hypothetical protein